MFYPSRPAVVIIGAGPFGVSIAAHLKMAGIDFRIFGKPIHRWQHQMPKGMFLKSEGRASNLSDPTGNHTLARYCAERGLPYHEAGLPVPLQTFTDYALWFQRSLVANVEDMMVTCVEKSSDGFHVRLSNGELVRTPKIVVATGLEHMSYFPSELASLPSELVSHSSARHDLGCFSGKEVAIVGAGQSALETAALLAEQGTSVRVLVRKPAVVWNEAAKTGPRPLYKRLRYPSSQLGVGLRLWFYCAAPALFRCLPEELRLERAHGELGPAGASWLKDRIEGRVQILAGRLVAKADARGGRAVLKVLGEDGQFSEMPADHVIAATGYRFDLRRLTFLTEEIKARVHTAAHQPVLSSGFESSVRGIYFTGLASASSFGPAMRFLCGTSYTAKSVSQHIAMERRRYLSAPSVQCAGGES